MRSSVVAVLVLVLTGCRAPDTAVPLDRTATAPPTRLEPTEASPAAIPSPPVDEPADAGADGGLALRDPVHHHEPLVLAGATVQGPCVDPTPWLRQRHPDMGDSFYEKAPQDADIDLDGDGVNDPAYLGGAARWEVEYNLFVRRGDCAYSVGAVPSSSGLVTLRTKHNGLFDIRTSSDSCPLAERRGQSATSPRYCETDWRFGGKDYAPFAERKTKVTPSGVLP